jgi:hypothetical protein
LIALLFTGHFTGGTYTFRSRRMASPHLRELPIAVLWVRAVEAFAVSIRNTRSIEEKEHEAESFEKQVIFYRTLRAASRIVGGVSLGAGTVSDAGKASSACSLFRD